MDKTMPFEQVLSESASHNKFYCALLFIRYGEDLNNELVRYLIHGDYHLPGIQGRHSPISHFSLQQSKQSNPGLRKKRLGESHLMSFLSTKKALFKFICTFHENVSKIQIENFLMPSAKNNKTKFAKLILLTFSQNFRLNCDREQAAPQKQSQKAPTRLISHVSS